MAVAVRELDGAIVREASCEVEWTGQGSPRHGRDHASFCPGLSQRRERVGGVPMRPGVPRLSRSCGQAIGPSRLKGSLRTGRRLCDGLCRDRIAGQAESVEGVAKAGRRML